jgi:hypothetical protein
MIQVGEGKWLFGLTLVFPWALHILHQIPAAMMTDSTFKVLKPGTLAILHAVFANQTVGVGFSVSPTECSGSYERLYSHIISLINEKPDLFSEANYRQWVDKAEEAEKGGIEFQVVVEESFFPKSVEETIPPHILEEILPQVGETVPEGLLNEVEEKYRGHVRQCVEQVARKNMELKLIQDIPEEAERARGNFAPDVDIPPMDEPELEEEIDSGPCMPSAAPVADSLPGDVSWECTDWADPSGWSVPPPGPTPVSPPRPPAFSSPQDCDRWVSSFVREDCPARPLTSIPIVTDMGRALERFVKKFQLTWFICHRHIIEAVGSNSPVGDMVARLLRTFSEEEFRDTRAVIIYEIDARWPKDSAGHRNYPKNIRPLLMMIGWIPAEYRYEMAHWALWLRFGRPNTANGGESVHGHLNSECVAFETFVERISMVIRHLIARYNLLLRNGGSVTRANKHKWWPSEEQLDMPWFSVAQWMFYLSLHTLHGQDLPLRKWALCRCNNQFMLHQVSVDLPTALTAPKGWPKQKAARSKEQEQVLKFQIQYAETLFGHIGYGLAWRIHEHFGEKFWLDRGGMVHNYITARGREMGLPENERASPDLECQWRMDVWNYAEAVWRSWAKK